MTILFADASKYDKGEPQQLAAWAYLQKAVSPEIIATFGELFRKVPPGPKKLLPSSPLGQNITANFILQMLGELPTKTGAWELLKQIKDQADPQVPAEPTEE